jgi:hypothetical protein
VASTIEEGKARRSPGGLRWREIASEQLMPKNFPSTIPRRTSASTGHWDESALAIVAATGRNPELAGQSTRSH